MIMGGGDTPEFWTVDAISDAVLCDHGYSHQRCVREKEKERGRKREEGRDREKRDREEKKRRKNLER